MTNVQFTRGIGCYGLSIDGLPLIDGKSGGLFLLSPKIVASYEAGYADRDLLRILKAMREPERLKVIS